MREIIFKLFTLTFTAGAGWAFGLTFGLPALAIVGGGLVFTVIAIPAFLFATQPSTLSRPTTSALTVRPQQLQTRPARYVVLNNANAIAKGK